jgi:hypothetical protein
MQCPLNFEYIFTGEIASPLGFYIYSFFPKTISSVVL